MRRLTYRAIGYARHCSACGDELRDGARVIEVDTLPVTLAHMACVPRLAKLTKQSNTRAGKRTMRTALHTGRRTAGKGARTVGGHLRSRGSAAACGLYKV